MPRRQKQNLFCRLSLQRILQSSRTVDIQASCSFSTTGCQQSSHYHHHNFDIYIGFSNGRIFCLFCTFARKTKKTFAITWILMSVQNLNFMYIYLLFTKNILNAVEFVCFSFFFLKNYTNFEVDLKKRYITQYQGTIINKTGFCSIALLIIFMCLYASQPSTCPALLVCMRTLETNGCLLQEFSSNCKMVLLSEQKVELSLFFQGKQ